MSLLAKVEMTAATVRSSPVALGANAAVALPLEVDLKAMSRRLSHLSSDLRQVSEESGQPALTGLFCLS